MQFLSRILNSEKKKFKIVKIVLKLFIKQINYLKYNSRKKNILLSFSFILLRLKIK